jgi:hypothetical protein
MSKIKRINKFRSLPFKEKLLFVESLFLLIALRLGLSLFSFKALLNLLEKVRQKPDEKILKQHAIDRMAWIINVSSRYLPFSTCLTKALTLQILLARKGLPYSLHIGISKTNGGKLKAHAWLKSEGRIVYLEDLSKYSLLPLNEFDQTDAI